MGDSRNLSPGDPQALWMGQHHPSGYSYRLSPVAYWPFLSFVKHGGHSQHSHFFVKSHCVFATAARSLGLTDINAGTESSSDLPKVTQPEAALGQRPWYLY